MRRANLLPALVTLTLACAPPALAVEQFAVPVTKPKPTTLSRDLYFPSGAGRIPPSP